MLFLEKFTIKEQFDLLERWILVHSIIYYEYNENVVEDYTYDRNCVQLVKMMGDYPEVFIKSKYYKVFKGFDGSTGVHLYNTLKKAQPKEFCIIMNDVFIVLDYKEDYHG